LTLLFFCDIINTNQPTNTDIVMNEIATSNTSFEKYNLGLNLRPDICYFGNVSDRGVSKNFGILQDDRRRHMYILGKSGMGKSTLLENMILQDIYNGHGVCFLDPHGDSASYILDRIPSFRQNDVIYVNPSDTDFPIGLNMLENNRGEEAFLIASGMMAVFSRIWAGMWSSRMEYILNNTLLALLETPGNTLLAVVRLLTDNDFRKKIVGNVTDPLVKNFWNKEFAGFNDKYRTEAIAPILNKIGQFFSTDLVRNILGQAKSTIDMRDIMDNRKIFIVNLSKGRLGEDNSNLLGSLIVTKLQLAAMGRVDMPESVRADFYLYVDEFQNFTSDSFATILSEARKYRLNLILAHQYISQLTESGNEKIRNAIFGNVGTMVSFRVGSDDGAVLEKEFEPVFQSQQLINLNARQVALKMSIGGKPCMPFIASTLPPIFADLGGRMETVVAISRERNTRPKAEVKEKINRWLGDDFGEEIATPANQNSSSGQGKPPWQNKPYAKQGGDSRPTGGYNQGPNSLSYNQNQNRQSTPQQPRNPENDGEAKFKKKKPNPFLQATRDDRNNNPRFQHDKSSDIGTKNSENTANITKQRQLDMLQNLKNKLPGKN
jgi:Type IV secretion-system coupling protein DNA-binding domain